jgi:hypothetical protein
MVAGSFCLFAMEVSVSVLRQYWVAGLFKEITSDLNIAAIEDLQRGAVVLSMSRFRSAFFAAWGLGYLLFLWKGSGRIFIGTGMAILAAISGYRADFVATVSFIFALFFFVMASPMKYFSRVIPFLLAMLVCLYVALPVLPSSIQRSAAAVLPNRIDPAVLAGTESSSRFRTELYKLCIENLPKYVWKGRGLAQDMQTLIATWHRSGHLRGQNDVVYYYFDQGGYHLGIFNILIDGSVFFAVALFVFLGLIFRRSMHSKIRDWSAEKKYLFCYFFGYMFYVLFMGEAPFSRMEIWMMLATALYLACEQKTDAGCREVTPRDRNLSKQTN